MQSIGLYMFSAQFHHCKFGVGILMLDVVARSGDIVVGVLQLPKQVRVVHGSLQTASSDESVLLIVNRKYCAVPVTIY